MFSIQEIQKISHRSFLNCDMMKRGKVKRVITDSRIIKPGDLFIAIRGDRFDGHSFVRTAFEHGAACAIVDEQFGNASMKYPLIVVENTITAMGELARFHRRRFSIPIIAITGSSGKTTTKEMVKAVLRSKYKVLYTEGNFNNHIGVPQTLFRLNSTHDLAVIEMGMNHTGEIKYLCDIAEPTHGAITNIGSAHLEYFKNKKKISEAKGELFDWLGVNKKRIGFVNLDDELIAQQARTLKKKITYSEVSRHAHVLGVITRVNVNGCARFRLSNNVKRESTEISLRIPGVHNVSNALAAAAIGNVFGIPLNDIKTALSRVRSVKGRMEVMHISGITIINDAYNANPESVLSALRTVASMDCKGRRIIVLGDMLELGSAAVNEHRKVAAALSKLRCDVLFLHGAYSKCIFEVAAITEKYYFAEKEQLIQMLSSCVRMNDIVLVKGSHGMNMQKIVDALKNSLSKHNGNCELN